MLVVTLPRLRQPTISSSSPDLLISCKRRADLPFPWSILTLWLWARAWRGSRGGRGAPQGGGAGRWGGGGRAEKRGSAYWCWRRAASWVDGRRHFAIAKRASSSTTVSTSCSAAI